MDPDNTPGADNSPATHAFGELRAEISLLRRAVERLTDERTSTPDYGPSLEAIAKRLEDVCGWAKQMSEKPALRLTPETLGREIATAATNSRTQDQQMVQRAASAMEAQGNRIDAMIERARSVADQKRELARNRIAFAIAGMVLFAILPGILARSLPASWAVPEWIASRVIRADMWDAGQDMMIKADPDRWARIVNDEHERASSQRK